MSDNGQEPREQVEERVALRTALAKLQADVKAAMQGEGPLSPFLKPPPPPPQPVPGVDYEPPAAAKFHKAGGGGWRDWTAEAFPGRMHEQLIAQSQDRARRGEPTRRDNPRRQAPSPSPPSEAPSEPQEAPGTPQPSSPGKSSNTSSTGVLAPDAAPGIPRLRME